MSAASPGVVGLFFRNDFYPDHESYIFALAEAMRHEYEAIVEAGILLHRSTARTSRWGGTRSTASCRWQGSGSAWNCTSRL